ncbi:MAG: HlyD family secretion protein [Bacteroidetes bacterium]|nr:HlyD family secretion protein [Bacteroidota bacterium]MBS1650039.1 HlyD family secretion protein [Bacteroidota bacterium]
MTKKQPKTEKKQSPLKLVFLIAALLVGGYFGYKKINFSLTHETTDNAQIETQITPVLPRVAGYIKSINIKDYDSVKAGDTVISIDDADLQTQLTEMQADYNQTIADVENAKAALNNAIVSLKVNKGNIDISKVKLQQAEENLQRDKNLYNSEAITKKQLDDSRYAVETTQKQLDNSNNDLITANSRIAIMQAGVKKAEAAIDIKKAKIEQQLLKISYTKIITPTTGKIGKIAVSEGQFVQAGTPLFSIVNDTAYWVVANFKENQLYALTPGKKVELRVDAYPNEKITGTVASLSEATGAKFALLPPDNSSGNFVKVTQRVPVKIMIDDLQKYKQLLRAGLSVYVVASSK